MKRIICLLLLILLVGCGHREVEETEINPENCKTIRYTTREEYRNSFVGDTSNPVYCDLELCCEFQTTFGSCDRARCYKR